MPYYNEEHIILAENQLKILKKIGQYFRHF
jgi:hypothetical protein